jgi:hypothetical protein
MWIKLRLLGHVTEPTLVRHQVAMDGRASEPDLAGGRLHDAGDHLHGGRLPGPVGAQVARDFAGARAKADLVDGGDSGKAFRDVAQLKH